jgi:ubiquinone/menaquinone biosynthesis C-methylase UbiE
MMQESHPAAVTPERIMQLMGGFWVARTLATGVQLRVFSLIAGGSTTLTALLEATGASRRGLPRLLDALVSLKLLTREGTGGAARYGVPPDAEAYLVEGKPLYLGDLVLLNAREVDEAWKYLPEAVRTGQPVEAVDQPELGIPFWRRLVGSLFAVGCPAARTMGEELRRRYPAGALRLLDVAAGSGVWGSGAARGHERVRVTAMDLPETLEVTREFVARHGLEAQYDYLPGNLRTADFGEARFEAAVLGQICHSEGVAESQRLFRKVHRALRPGGTLVIADRFPDPERRENTAALLFSLNMLVRTTEGDTWTLPEYTAWLEEAGFREIRPLAVPGPDPLLLATRPGA